MTRYLLAAVLIAAITSIATPAQAHPIPSAYSPDDGATISTPPSEVWVEFDQTLSDGDLQVIDPCGQRVDDGNAQVLANRISVAVSSDRSGIYTAQWIAMGTDPHKVSGDWSFTVTDGDPCPGSEPADPKDDPQGNGAASSSDDDDEASVGATGASDDDDGDGDSAAVGGKPDRKKSKDSKHRHSGNKDEEPTSEDNAGNGADLSEAPPVSEDIPIDWLLISFAVAALIGAVAGRIYVDLAPPR